MPEALIYFLAISLAVALVILFDTRRSVAVEGDEIVVTEFGRRRSLHKDDIKAATLRIDALGSPVLVLVGSKPSSSVVVPVPRRVHEDTSLRRVVDLIRGTAERGADVDPDVLSL
ncbi:MAG: hypothetical protein ACKOA6_14345 [Actinomycetota bacterium]